MYILLAESNSLNRWILQSGLALLGHTYKTADSGRELLKLYKREFDLIVINIPLADLEAIDVIREIRAKETKRNLILGFSDCSKDLKTLYLRAGFNEIYNKPGSLKELETIINKYNSTYQLKAFA